MKVKRSVKADRDTWLNALLEKGAWDQIKSYRKGVKHKQGRLRNLQGHLVSSEERAETLAEYLEKVQRAVRPTIPPVSHQPLGPTLPVNTNDITEHEVVCAARKLKSGKACGIDDIPPEFWKTICTPGSKACQWAVVLCKKCWSDGCVPQAWHEARVAAIFKKGDVADCGNYKPISLLTRGHNLFANILLARLKEAGAESRIWFTQLGFCSQRGTLDAVFLARIILEEAIQ